jgi:hypothetical protein
VHRFDGPFSKCREIARVTIFESVVASAALRFIETLRHSFDIVMQWFYRYEGARIDCVAAQGRAFALRIYLRSKNRQQSGRFE